MRSALRQCETIVIKAGTSVVSNDDGSPSIVRLSGIVEQAATLMAQKKRVILVSSGAVGCGRRLLRKQEALSSSFRQLHLEQQTAGSSGRYDSASAAAGQLRLMSLYETLFSCRDVECSQFLVTQTDIEDETRRANLKYALSQILEVGMIPIVNENDAVSANKGYGVADSAFSDNDGLAALVAQLCDASLLVLLSDVAGLYDRPPTTPGARLVSVCRPTSKFVVGDKSERGRGGIQAKVKSAFRALDLGVRYVALASGLETGVVLEILDGKNVGTLFVHDNGEEVAESSVEIARKARQAGRALQAAPADKRTQMLLAIADALETNVDAVLAANQRDKEASVDAAPALRQRLGLSKEKLATLAKGARTLAEAPDPVHKLLERRELSPGLVLEKRAAPLGVVLVVFESRPEALVQIACLAIRAGCALLLKGGSEAARSNAALKNLIDKAVAPDETIYLLDSREAVAELLAHPESTSLVDLVVPRGSNALVRAIQSATKIPVLGHADGVCHCFVHRDADLDKAKAVALDSKTDYPAACNAVETLLLHADFPHARALLDYLRDNGCRLLAGPNAIALLPDSERAKSLSTEFGDNTMLVEVVPSLEAAIDFVNTHSSNHTDAVITESSEVAQAFFREVDSACVFRNASTRFSDGFRFGLGAELGVATGRLHARGPVGVDGFLTYKWLLASDDFHTQQQFAQKAKAYTHTQLYP